MENDKILTSRIKKGDRLAFTQLYLRYHRMVYIIAYKYLYDTYRAEDAVQWLFLRIWEVRDQLREEVPIKSFIHFILKNYLLNEIRNIENSHTLLNDYYRFYEESENVIEERIEAEEKSAELQKHIGNLSPQRQLICKMKIQEELSNQQIADELNISVNTVKVQYNHIIKQLRQKLGAVKCLFYILWIIFFK